MTEVLIISVAVSICTYICQPCYRFKFFGLVKVNLLNTRTANYFELIGNGRIYRVPPYQRDYSWHEEQWEDLWSDVLELSIDPDNSHYMGALVVEGKSDREFSIIDGQQRLATLSILALAVIAKLHELANQGLETDDNLERAANLRSRFKRKLYSFSYPHQRSTKKN